MKKGYAIDKDQFSKKYLNLQYANKSDLNCLDLYLPEGEGPYPLIMLVHGGGFMGGYKDQGSIFGVGKVVSQGYALAAVDYRLSLHCNWPEPVHDVKCAIRYLRANQQKYNIAADNIVLWSSSAGAAIAQAVAATGDKQEYEEYNDISMGYPEESSAIQGLISIYGVADFVSGAAFDNLKPREFYLSVCGPTPADEELYMNQEYVDAVELILGYHLNNIENVIKAAKNSPFALAKGDYPPALFQHGTADPVAPFSDSVNVAVKVNELAGEERVIFEMFEGATHGGHVFWQNENIERGLDFIDGILFGEKRQRMPFPELKIIEISN
jgi:acetyl esterase/lipase